ncbi:MAG: disulfide bond formation protein DsbA [Rhodospirillaceae bacterium]|nr:disulfide bond formation protein DsbA [Rhodospirillaceae bacterium]
MPRHIVRIRFFAVMIMAFMWASVDLSAQTLPPAEEILSERVLGNSDAKVTMIEYASMTCPHCANFHTKTFPAIKKEYIVTGKIKFIYRDFPLDQVALAAAMMARCSAKERYFGVIDVIFRTQREWGRNPNPRKALEQIGKIVGVSESTYEACVTDKVVHDGMIKMRNDAVEKYKVRTTPTFVVNEKKINGGLPLEELRKVLDAAVAKAS